MALTAAELLRKKPAELDALFREAPPGNLPEGEGTGTALIAPGCICAKVFAWFIRWFFWQGKVFDAAQRCLVNRILPFGVKAIKAQVSKEKSWLDGQECIVLDYARTSLVARCIRDEIREVAPGLYLGKVFLGKKPTIHFTISFQYQPERKFWRRVVAVAVTVVVVFAAYLAMRFQWVLAGAL